MKKYLLRELRIVVVLFIPVLVLMLFWDSIPSQIPVQWSMDGLPVSYQPKYIIPFINVGIYYLLLIKTILTTDNFHFDLSVNSYFKLRYVVFIILSFINILLLMFGAGYDINSSNIIFLSLFFALIIISEFIQYFNLFFPIGIMSRTSKSRLVWVHSHKLISMFCFWLGLFGVLLNIIFGNNVAIIINMFIIMLIIISPIVISIYFYRHFQLSRIY